MYYDTSNLVLTNTLLLNIIPFGTITQLIYSITCQHFRMLADFIRTPSNFNNAKPLLPTSLHHHLPSMHTSKATQQTVVTCIILKPCSLPIPINHYSNKS